MREVFHAFQFLKGVIGMGLYLMCALFQISLHILSCSYSLYLSLAILLAGNSDYDLLLGCHLLLFNILGCHLARVSLLVRNVTFTVVFAAEHTGELVLLGFWAD